MNSKWVNILSGVGVTTLSAIAVVLAMAGCDKGNEVDSVEASVEGKFELNSVFGITNTGIEAGVIVDKETGVSYLIIESNHGMTITPLYNADGSLKVEGGNENAK